MTTTRSGRKSKTDGASGANDLIERLSANLSRKEIQNIFGRSLLSLDPAGIERLAAGLDAETAATLRRVVKSPRKSAKSKTARPTTGKTRQEWDLAWRDWDACIAETADEGGKYVFREHHLEPPYLPG
jgi:hypothetical protein